MNIESELRELADRYENKEFLDGDPSWFMHQVEDASDKELLAFIASALSYGSRIQFLPKIQIILDDIKDNGCSVGEWLIKGLYNDIIPKGNRCFYRLYNNAVMNDFLRALAELVEKHGSFKTFAVSVGSDKAIDIIKAITVWFASHGSVGVIPKDTSSSCKRVCMFLRWMVRDNSPVDLGLWSDIIDKKTLIIPMDTHVVQEANRLGLVSSKSTSMSAALRLSAKLAEIWPDDPIKGDFALFGVGVKPLPYPLHLSEGNR